MRNVITSFLLLAIVVILSANIAFSQTIASGTWTLTLDSSVIVVGNVTAIPASGGTGIGAITYGAAGMVSTGWNSVSRDTADYYQFIISPVAGNNLTVSTTSFTNSTSSLTLTAGVFYSTNSGLSFTQIGSNISVTTVQTPWSDTTHITVNSGTTLIMKIYGWGASSANTKFRVRSFVISGTTSSNLPLPSAPVLISPANNSTGLPLNVLCNWRKALETGKKYDKTISAYWYEYSTDSTFATVIARDSSLTDTTKSLTGLSNITKYYWRVKAKNQTGWGSFSSIWNFTTMPSVPSVPVLIYPGNNSFDIITTPALDWEDAATANSYRIQISTSSIFTTTVYDTTGLILSTITVPVGKLTTNTFYYWRVNATNSGGTSDWSTVWNFKTTPDVPTIPVLSFPANNSTGHATSLTFVWYKAVEQLKAVSKYWLEYSTDSTFTTVISRDSSLTDTTKSITGLSNITKYYWRVKAMNQAGWGGFSTIWNFTTLLPIPVTPVHTSPANNATGISLTPALVWGSVTYASSYRIQVSTDSTFATNAFDTSGVTVTTLNVPAGKLTGLTRYHWRVNATNTSGTSGWSTKWSFTTLQNLPVTLKVYFEGFWNGTSQVQDTVKIYLANSVTPFAFVDTAKIVLSAAGTASFSFSKVSNGNYYIVVSHRNHLETWSKLPQTLTTNVTLSYDFTTAATQAYGNNMKQAGSVWMLYGGDANMDGSIDANDIPFIIAQFGTQGYLSADFNGDSDVNATDIALFAPNFGITKVVPTVVMVRAIKNKVR